MSYVEIDPVIQDWAKRHRSYLFTEHADRDARFAYFSSNIGECFQIAIDAPCDGHVTIYARDIETQHDEEMHVKVTVRQLELRDALDQMINTVYGWMKRYDASATRHYS